MVLGKGLEEIEGIDFETTVTCEWGVTGRERGPLEVRSKTEILKLQRSLEYIVNKKTLAE